MTIQQRTPEWLDLRRKYIGSSDAAPILGVSPWKTPLDIFHEKTSIISRESSICSSMQRGIDLEPEALQLFEKLTGYLCLPQVVFHPTIKFMMASLDGMEIGGNAIVEIKCPGKIDHECALDGQVPAKYIPQLQHQMETCGLKKMFYLSYNINSYKLLEVHYDQNYVENLLKEEREFWDCVLTKTEPKVKSKYVQMTNKEWTDAADEYRDISKQIKALETRQRACKDRLFAIANGTPSQGGGVTVSKTIKKGIVDIESFAKDTGRNPEEYRKEPREEWSVRVQ